MCWKNPTWWANFKKLILISSHSHGNNCWKLNVTIAIGTLLLIDRHQSPNMNRSIILTTIFPNVTRLTVDDIVQSNIHPWSMHFPSHRLVPVSQLSGHLDHLALSGQDNAWFVIWEVLVGAMIGVLYHWHGPAVYWHCCTWSQTRMILVVRIKTVQTFYKAFANILLPHCVHIF